MWYGYLADLVVGVHLAYVTYVVLGQLFILIGLAAGWKCIRNPWFRWTHLMMICVVAAESLIDMPCPLTTWEYQLRRLAGQKIDGGAVLDSEQPTFIGQLMHDVMFFDLPYNDRAFEIGYVTFALVVLATFLLAPPRPFRRKEEAGHDNPASSKVSV